MAYWIAAKCYPVRIALVCNLFKICSLKTDYLQMRGIIMAVDIAIKQWSHMNIWKRKRQKYRITEQIIMLVVNTKKWLPSMKFLKAIAASHQISSFEDRMKPFQIKREKKHTN
uniref:Uncharacterized protein n=1 Tax=Wuchereria bancrofti TaxID=6293 RepID=A0AAF5PHK2_WUCBA